VQKDNSTLTVSDLVCDDNFVRHYLSPTEQSTLFWNEWLIQNPTLQNEWGQAQKLIQDVQLGLNDYAHTYLTKEAEEQLLARIKETIAQHEVEKVIVPLWRKIWVVTAAAACLLVFFGIVFWKISGNNKNLYQQQITSLKDTPIEKINDSSNPLLITLPDGSTASLSPKSKISYTADFGQNNRKIFLLGEATFEVVKNPSKPFYVYANELVTKVLGTKFTIKSYEDKKDIVVTVAHGQVSVYEHEKADTQALKGVLLTPNQQVVFVKETEKFTKTIVAEPILLPSETNTDFVFEETPISAVFTLLEKSYGIEMVFNKELLKKCQLTASLNGLPLFQQLDIITQSVGASYNVVEGKVIISTQGCK
jgi:transmembrane sensor